MPAAAGEKKHLVFIVNPRSGTDRVKAVEAVITAGLDPARYTHEIRFTERAGHGTDLAREAAGAGAFAVVAVGGDGSVADAAAGVLGTGSALGIFPKGSGNGLARALGIPLAPAGAVRVLNGGTVRRIDVGRAAGRPFLSNAGVGFTAVVSQAFARSKRRGFFSYAGLVTQHLWGHRALEYELTVDGHTRRVRAFIIAVANGSQFGYNFRIAPTALLDDGVLDVVVIRPFPKLTAAAGISLRAARGKILQSRYVEHHRARNVRIAAPGLSLMQTDGDAHPCGTAVDFSVEPSALRVLVPGG